MVRTEVRYHRQLAQPENAASDFVPRIQLLLFCHNFSFFSSEFSLNNLFVGKAFSSIFRLSLCWRMSQQLLLDLSIGWESLAREVAFSPSPPSPPILRECRSPPPPPLLLPPPPVSSPPLSSGRSRPTPPPPPRLLAGLRGTAGLTCTKRVSPITSNKICNETLTKAGLNLSVALSSFQSTIHPQNFTPGLVWTFMWSPHCGHAYGLHLKCNWT